MPSRRLKYKIITKGKSYRIGDSPLYKVISKKKLASTLGVPISELTELQKDLGNYAVFTQIGKSGKPRLIEHPNEKLDKIHSRIASYLCRLAIPDYIHSGVKNRSYVSNASAHKNSAEILTLDIKAYYTNTSWKHIFKMFVKKFKCSEDVAYILADICTYDGHVPTGSRVSMPIALWANIDMFEDIKNYISNYNLLLSVYVDDITISGEKIPRFLAAKLKNILQKHQHTMHPDKTNLYKAHEVKVVTGVVLRDGKLCIKNSQHMAIKQDIEKWLACRFDNSSVPSTLITRILGRLNALSVIEPKLRDKARSIVEYNRTNHVATV